MAIGNTVAVNPVTRKPDPHSSFRVSADQVGVSVSPGPSTPGSSKRSNTGDVRAESYKVIAAEQKEQRLANKPDLSGQVSIKPSSIVKSQVAGVTQIAVKGGIQENVKYTPAPIPKPEGVPISQGLAQKIIGGGQPISLRADVQYYAIPESRFLVVGSARYLMSKQVVNPGRYSYGNTFDRLFPVRQSVDFMFVQPGSVRGKLASLEASAGGQIIKGALNPFYMIGMGFGKAGFNMIPHGFKDLLPSQRLIADRRLVELVRSDRDVQAFTFAGGAALTSLIYPPAGVAIAAGTFGYGVYSGVKAFSAKDYFKFGESGTVALSGLLGTADFVKGVYIKTGSKFRPQEDVFASEVLSGRSRFALSGSIKESLINFAKAEYRVSTASPSALKGTFAEAGPAGRMGLEDAGIYVAPKGSVSPHFLKISGEGGLTLNPFKNLFGLPSVTEFETLGVVRYPSKILREPGFKAVSEFGRDVLSKKGVAVITKRSELGQGSIPAQWFSLEHSVFINNKFYPKGSFVKELSTSEMEAVIPVNTQFSYMPKSFLGRIKGFDEYTVYEGKAVSIREAVLLKEGIKMSNEPFSFKVSGRQVFSEASSLSSRISTRSLPYSFLPLSYFERSPQLKQYYSSKGLPSSYPIFSIPLASSISRVQSNRYSFNSGFFGFSRGGSPSRPDYNVSASSILKGGSSTGGSSRSLPTYFMPSSSSNYGGRSFYNTYYAMNSFKNMWRGNREIKFNEKRYKPKKRSSKLSKMESFIYVLPDLRSVNITEMSGREAVAPRLSLKVKGLFGRAFSGYGGFVPTAQIQRRLRL